MTVAAASVAAVGTPQWLQTAVEEYGVLAKAKLSGPGDREGTVGGRNVLGSWFGYRKASPAGRRSSPLDDMHVTAWPAEWSVELVDVLTVLTRLTELEPEQGSLLDAVLAGPLLSRNELAQRSVAWPRTARDRRARPATRLEGNAGTAPMLDV